MTHEPSGHTVPGRVATDSASTSASANTGTISAAISIAALASVLAGVASPRPAQAKGASGATHVTADAGPVTPWPRAIPVRLEPRGGGGARDDIMITTLGEVRTPLADGSFDPVADRVTTSDGRVLDHYYRDSLGITYYEPLDKSIFPVPP
jgi:hypothetical protein